MAAHDAFTWQDGERTIAFGRGVSERAVELLGGPGYTLLTTPRGEAALPAVVAAARAVHHVAAGRVDEVAGDLLGEVEGERIAALGGGRVIDVAKAVAAARRAGGGAGFEGGRHDTRALALPTTLSGAEMTVIHRAARGAPEGAGSVRPAVVVNDPALSASQPEPELAASALNALGHAIEGPRTPRAHPVARLAAAEAARLIAAALGHDDPVDRDALALGALLAGYTIDSTGYGLHHVLSQTLVRVAGAAHGPANAVLLPHTARRLGAADGAALAERILPRTGVTRLRDIGVERDALPRCADEAARRPQLDATPPRATRDEILALYETAW